MSLTPLTPPSELSDPTSNIYTPIDAVLPEFAHHYGFDTPVSNTSTPLATIEEGPETDERLESLDSSVEDADMSDGGVALSPTESTATGGPSAMAFSHAQQLNAEMDLLDAEIMGEANLQDMYGDLHPDDAYSWLAEAQPPQHYHPAHGLAPVAPYMPLPHYLPINPGMAMFQPPNTYNNHNLLTVEDLTEQLEHLQDQDMFNSLDPHNAEGQDGTFFNPMEDQENLGLAEFFYTWARTTIPGRRPRGPNLAEVIRQRDLRNVEPMERSDLAGERCDFQGLDWKQLGVSRRKALQMRKRTYKNYTNIRYPGYWHPRVDGSRLENDDSFFKFRRMDFDRHVKMSHFQLRNLLACASRDHILYAGHSKIMDFTPRLGGIRPEPSSVVMDLTNPHVQAANNLTGSVQISTMTVGHNVLVAGGFNGEYGLINLRADKKTQHTEGLTTDHLNSITNHIQVHLSRGSSLPRATFSSNDNFLRILDINTNKLIAQHQYDKPVNCSAISPDQRLRVIVGDSQKVMICNSETGQVLQELDGHRDYGFACDWADDGWTVATGNQDMQVKIWDARMWKDSSGISQPIASIASEVAGVRKLRFSPLGSGKRVLVAAEPADHVNIIDASTFLTKQRLSFFGEIGGFDFADNGQDLIVANCDKMRGGIMQFERCTTTSQDIPRFESERVPYHKSYRCLANLSEGFDWTEEQDDAITHPKSYGTRMNRTRKAAMLGTNMDPF